MIPYFEAPTIALGGFTIHAFSVTSALAVVTGVTLVVRRAPAHGIAVHDAKQLVVWTVVAGFVGSHLFSTLAYFPRQVLGNPLELLRIWGGMSSFGGMLGGMAGAWLVMRRWGWTIRRRLAFIDLVAWAFPFAWLFGRLGCFLVHDHIGVPSTLWLAVDFPAGPRWDLGLLELIATVPIAGLFAWLARVHRANGLYLCSFFLLYSPARFGLDMLRVADTRYWGLTPGQYMAAFMFIIALGLSAALWRRSRS